jgi:hypothetical protein
MKIYKILMVNLFFFFLNSFFIYGQGETVANYIMLFGQIDVPLNTTITHTMTAIDTYWELDNMNQEFPISYNSDWEVGTATMTGSTTSTPSTSGTNPWKGFYFPWLTGAYIYTDNIAYGFYKVTNSYNNYYFYINMRDCKYGGPIWMTGWYNPDIHIRYDYSLNKFERQSPQDWLEIQVGEVLNVWDLRNDGETPNTSFEDFWSNALVETNNGSDNPRVVWGPYPNPGSLPGTITGYKVYRSANHVPGQPGTFSLLTTINDPDV